MKKIISVLALLALLVAAAPASANYQLIFGYAKRAISRETASVCAQTQGCKSWSVKPCKRRSLHRVDCRSNFYFPEGGYCTFVTTATLPPWATDVIIHHKRIDCR